MSYFLNTDEIVQTIRMIEQEHLDVRTITLGLSLLDCATGDIKRTADKVYEKICREAHDLVPVGEAIEREFGIPIVNKRVSVTPVALIAGGCGDDLVPIAEAMDRAAREVGVNYIGGFSALVQKGFTTGDRSLIASIPEALARTERVCASVNVGVSGPGVVYQALQECKGESFDVVAETIKRTAFKVTRMGQLVAREASRRLGVPFGIVDLSLAPTPAVGDSVARILETMGLEVCGTHGTTAALALLNDAVKKGGVMASGHVGGLSGAFIPVSEDEGMIAAAREGTLTLDKLEAMTCVCSVGLDMIAVPGDTSAETLSAILADEAAIGMINNKTTAVRLIPAPGKTVGDTVEIGGLFGEAPVMPVHAASSAEFIARGGRIPAPLHSLRN